MIAALVLNGLDMEATHMDLAQSSSNSMGGGGSRLSWCHNPSKGLARGFLDGKHLQPLERLLGDEADPDGSAVEAIRQASFLKPNFGLTTILPGNGTERLGEQPIFVWGLNFPSKEGGCS